jgi:NADPH-dependent 2,4-dienoyl-CoA reductase/sulfur reductase-like enzyme
VRDVDVAIIGGGPAGLAAALGAKKAGAEKVLVLERDRELGGILNQCIHNGFGLHTFKEELTGPEYSARFIKEVLAGNIETSLGTMVLELGADKAIKAVGARGVMEIKAKAVVLAMGCRERPRGALNIPGSRPSGIMTAGTAQKFVNIDGLMPGREAVILGSGDIGLIMARRLALEGAHVAAVAELMPHSSGLKRNIVQCLDDFGIPLMLSHTVVGIFGKDRLEGVSIARVDGSLRPIPGTEKLFPCDTLLLSVGLIPENELSKMAGVKLSPDTGGPVVNESFETSAPGVFACGNALHVHDLVDFVSEEAQEAGENAAAYACGKSFPGSGVAVVPGNGVRYAMPFSINPKNVKGKVSLRLRVAAERKNASLVVRIDGVQVAKRSKMVFAPGEMETLSLSGELFAKRPEMSRIEVSLEDRLA